MEGRCPNTESAVVIESANSIVEDIITKGSLWLYHKSVNKEGTQILNSGDVERKRERSCFQNC